MLVIVTVIGVALIAWIVSIKSMMGMSGAPGVAIGSLSWFLPFWVIMMAAMMLPSAYPMVLAHAQMTRAHVQHPGKAALSITLFVIGYLAAWALYGLIAYAAYRGIAALHLEWLTWDRFGPIGAGVAVAAVGFYQLTPLKQKCLQYCRSPSVFIINYWRPGMLGAVRMGLSQGIWCVGCCLGLMMLMFVLGIMSLVWMGVVTALIFVEKILPFKAMSLLVAIVCLALSVAVATTPAWVVHVGANPGSAEMVDMADME